MENTQVNPTPVENADHFFNYLQQIAQMRQSLLDAKVMVPGNKKWLLVFSYKEAAQEHAMEQALAAGKRLAIVTGSVKITQCDLCELFIDRDVTKGINLERVEKDTTYILEFKNDDKIVKSGDIAVADIPISRAIDALTDLAPMVVVYRADPAGMTPTKPAGYEFTRGIYASRGAFYSDGDKLIAFRNITGPSGANYDFTNKKVDPEMEIPAKVIPAKWPVLKDFDTTNPDHWLAMLDYEAMSEADMCGAAYVWDIVAGCFGITAYNSDVAKILGKKTLAVFNAVNEDKNFEFIAKNPEGELDLTMVYNFGDFSQLFTYGTSIRGMTFDLDGNSEFVPTTIVSEQVYGDNIGPMIETREEMDAYLTAVNRFVEMYKDNELVYARTHKEGQ